MKDRAISRAELDPAAVDLSEAAAVLFVAAGDPPPPVAPMLEVARAAARTGRRVALIDLCLEAPLLAQGEDVSGGEGIVDAFLFGASLPHVAAEQDVPGLFLIGTGTPAPDPSGLWSHERWQRLANGFASEGALLLLMLRPHAVRQLALRPDRVLVFGALGETERASLAGYAEDAVPVDRVAIPRTDPAPSPERSVAPSPRRRSRRPWAPVAIAAGVVVVLGVSVGAMLAMRQPVPPAPPAALVSQAPGTALPNEGGGDSLFYAVQVAAFQTAAAALEVADAYAEAGWVATVSPVRLGRQATWHRLVVGAYREPAGAEQALHRLWDDGTLDRLSGMILRTPYTLALGTFGDSTAAEAARRGLRAEGIAAYIVGSPDGSWRLCAGAFETPEQAERADSMLRRDNVTTTVVTRAGLTQ